MDVNDLDDLAKARAKDAEYVDDEDGGEELLANQDVIDAIALLRRCQNVLMYVSDVRIVKTVTKRERAVMDYVANEIAKFIDDRAEHYEGEEF